MFTVNINIDGFPIQRVLMGLLDKSVAELGTLDLLVSISSAIKLD